MALFLMEILPLSIEGGGSRVGPSQLPAAKVQKDFHQKVTRLKARVKFLELAQDFLIWKRKAMQFLQDVAWKRGGRLDLEASYSYLESINE